MTDLYEPIQDTPINPPVDPIATDVIEGSTPVSSTETVSQSRDDVRVEEFKINGDALVAKVKELLHQSNIRRIIIKAEDGHTLLEIPMTMGVVGGVVATAFFPVLAALGVLGALVAHLSVVIERKV